MVYSRRYMSGLLLVPGLLLASLAPLIGAPVPVAHAATFTVNDGGDSGNNNCTDGTCTLREAITAANFTVGADTIDFAPAVTQVTLNGSSNIVITDDVTIDGGDGNNRVTITRSVSPQRRVFQVGAPGGENDTTFESLVIEDGNQTTGNGGGIFISTEGTLTLRNSIVRNNTAGGRGGGIYNAGSLTLTDGSEVSGNQARGNFDGGGIYNDGGAVNISGDSVISSNQAGVIANGNGGGIHNNGGTVTVTNSTIENNSARNSLGGFSASDGGGIYNAAGGMVAITNSVFDNNRATNGGAVYNAGELTVGGSSTFTDNLAAATPGTSNGGGIYNAGGGTASVTDSTFPGNRTDLNPTPDSNDRGGALVNAAAGTLTVTTSGFGAGTIDDFNHAVGGGAIYNAGELTVTESDLDFNRANVEGGGIWNDGAGTATIRDSTLRQNEALAETGGGILQTSTGQMTIIGSTLEQNSATNPGGGINNAGSLQIINSTLSANTTGSLAAPADRGGGIANVSPGDLTLVQSTLVGNQSTGNNASAGGVYNAATLTLINSVVADSTGEDLINDGGTVTPQGNNIIADGSFTGTGISDGDPQLGLLASNGGPTETHLPQSGSPAIDAGDDSFLSEAALSIDFTGDGDTDDTLTSDQRSYARIANGTVDIGAVEVGGGAIAYSIALDTTSSAEGDDGDTTEIAITVTRSGATAVDSSVDVTLSGTATEGSDYTFALASGSAGSFDGTTLSFAAGTTAATFAVTVSGDTMSESDETVIVTLSNATAPETATISTVDATLTIQDDDGAPSVYLPLISR